MNRFTKGLMLACIAVAGYGAVSVYHSTPNINSFGADLWESPYLRVKQSSVMIRTKEGAGSGVVFGDNLVLTAKHVVKDYDVVEVILDSGEVVVSTHIYKYADEDIAFIECPVRHLNSVKWSAKMEVGQPIFVVGTPLGLEYLRGNVTKGCISSLGSCIPNVGDNMIVIDAAINPGNSGGGLFTMDGELIGMVVIYYSGANGMAAALPIDDVLAALEAYNVFRFERVFNEN